MNATRPRGNALTMTLMLIAVILVIVYAGTSLQPIEMRAIDQHYEYQNATARLDAAVEESVARLNAGASPEYSREQATGGHTEKVHVQRLGTAGDDVTVLIACRMFAVQSSRSDDVPREWKMTACATLRKGSHGWRVASFTNVTSQIAALTSSP